MANCVYSMHGTAAEGQLGAGRPSPSADKFSNVVDGLAGRAWASLRGLRRSTGGVTTRIEFVRPGEGCWQGSDDRGPTGAADLLDTIW